ncbi:MFS transporter [Ectothiorhodospiraceae bacterium 2226]|nr:MFS transporter [Ectothiorhodospiraceae bacterium 2226]
MLRLLVSVIALLFATAILLTGIGLLSTLLGLRGALAGFSDTTIGAIMSAYFVGYIVGTWLSPRLIRRVGHVRAFATLASIASASVLAHALIIDPWIWAGLRVVTGICLVGLYMIIESWLNAAAPNHRRGQVFATYMAVTLVAMAAGQYLILVADIADFALFALVTVLISLSLVPLTTSTGAEPHRVGGARTGLKRLYEVSPLGMLGAFAAGVTNGAFWALGAVFAHRTELTEVAIAAFMSALIVGGALLQWPIGRLSDHGERRVVLVVVALLAALLAAAIALAAHYWPAAMAVLAFFYGGMVFSIYSVSVACVNDHLEPLEILEATGGLLLLYGIGAIIGPLLGGVAMDRLGGPALFGGMAVILALLAAFGLLQLRRRHEAPPEHPEPFVPLHRTTPASVQMDPRADAEPELDLQR